MYTFLYSKGYAHSKTCMSSLKTKCIVRRKQCGGIANWLPLNYYLCKMFPAEGKLF